MSYTPRVGFACKFSSGELNTSTTTIQYLNRVGKASGYAKLENLVSNNLKALRKQLEYFRNVPLNQRMFRLSSEILPAYTHLDWCDFYKSVETRTLLEREFSRLGDLARELNIRLSFHPGQFCVLASESDVVVENSILEFEYHCDIIRWMGYGRVFQDFKCNVHIGGRRGPQGIRAVMGRLSPEARNTLTIENAEFTWGLASSLELWDVCALVVDIHHYWIETGLHLEPTDWRLRRVQDSWRGCRPVIHYSQSRSEFLEQWDPLVLPDFKSLGFTRTQLRAHSEDYCGNLAQNSLASSHLVWADIMLESKGREVAWRDFCDLYL